MQAMEEQVSVDNHARVDRVISPNVTVLNNQSNLSKKNTSKIKFSNWRDGPEMCFSRENESQTNYSNFNYSANSSEFYIEEETAGARCDVAVSNNMLRYKDQAGKCFLM